MKILLTSIGSLSAPFVIETIKNMQIEVIGTDMYPEKWIATSKDVHHFYRVHPVSKPKQYQNKILEICEEHGINMIIPLTDNDVDYYSDNMEKFSRKGIVVTLSKKDTIQLLRDKLKLYNVIKNSNIKVIPTYTQREYMKNCGIFPCVAKKINGRSSEGLYILKRQEDLQISDFTRHNYIFQPFIKGDIIVADILKPSNQNNVYIARRELTRTTNGAGIAVEIIRDRKLDEIIQYFCKIINFEGCINIEFVKNKSNYLIMDTNPRFSAGIAFSNIAGYNFVENHILSFLGKEVNELNYVNYGTIITRKYIEVIV